MCRSTTTTTTILSFSISLPPPSLFLRHHPAVAHPTLQVQKKLKMAPFQAHRPALRPASVKFTPVLLLLCLLPLLLLLHHHTLCTSAGLWSLYSTASTPVNCLDLEGGLWSSLGEDLDSGLCPRLCLCLCHGLAFHSFSGVFSLCCR